MQLRAIIRAHALAICFTIGLLLSLFLAAHGYALNGDQINLLRPGWLLAKHGTLTPVGNPATGGGYVPGALTSLLIGIPLLVWPDNRAPSFLLVLLHLVAYLLLDRVARERLSERGRLFFCVLYWLNPWRLFYSAFVWNPNYLVVFAALQLYSAYRLRERPGFWYSLMHVAAVGLAFQIDLSCFILLVASALLFARGYIKINWAGAFCGAVVVLLPLIPWFQLVAHDRSVLPVSGGFIGKGFLLVYPIVRGIFYWVRFPSLTLSPVMLVARSGSMMISIIYWISFVLTQIIGPLTALIVIAANIRLWRRGTKEHMLAKWSGSDREWLRGTVRWTFIAAVIAFGLTPVNISRWNAFPILPVAVLPMVFGLEALTRTRWSDWVNRATSAYVVIASALLLAASASAVYLN